jgi:hypothetical protein
VSSATIQRGASAALDARAAAPRRWLVGPWFDALLVANVAWPLLVLAQVGEGFNGRAGLEFWQVYYVTTPHRWITLALVFLDRERFRERRGVFLAVAACVAAVCLGVRMTTGALTCLLAVDYVWNAWHFSAQHHGVYRIYGRLNEPDRATGLTVEKWAMRLFLLYVIFRVAGATWANEVLERRLRTFDWFAAAIPAWLVLQEIARHRRGLSGGVVYLLSVSALYLSLLGAVHARRPGLVLSLTTASALFHAIEYLSVVGWSVRQRHAAEPGRLGLLGYLAPRWAIALSAFVLVLGAGGWLMDQHWMEAWLLINVVVAFLHYAYDGLIWRRPRAARSISSAARVAVISGKE